MTFNESENNMTTPETTTTCDPAPVDIDPGPIVNDAPTGVPVRASSWADLPAAFDAYFRLQVGTLAISREAVARLRLEAELNPEAGKYDRVGSPAGGMVILHRRLEQCHGGIQGFYVCRRHDADGREMLVQFAEHELVDWQEAAAAVRAMSRR